MPDTSKREHIFNAEAKLLEGNLRLPLVQHIHPQAHAQLESGGGYKAIHSRDFRLEGVVSFASAYTQVTGSPGTKPNQGWSTLSTTVIEKLNILEVVTADRVVGQIITEHPLSGYVPTISFLGTRFENLRIAGYPVELEFDLGFFGDKPEEDAPYTKSSAVVGRVSDQYARIRSHPKLPSDLSERYNRLSSTLGNAETVECSLINQAKGSYPGETFGHVITIPHFGTIALAVVSLKHEDFHPESGTPKKTTVQMKMIDCKFGCAIDGELMVAGPGNNGSSWP